MSQNAPKTKYSDYQYIIAYLVLIAILMLVARTRAGYVTIYYALALFAFFLVLVESNNIAKILAPATAA